MKGMLWGLLFFASLAMAGPRIVNVYNWSNYMPESVIRQFEQETGIKVNYAVFDSNETLYTKLKANPHSGYDVIVPSSYYVARMRNENMLLRLDKSKLPNAKYLNPEFLHKEFDPENDYTLPYFWGATGIVVNNKYFDPKKITCWADFWQSEYKSKLLMLDDMREVFAVGLKVLGYSLNETRSDNIERAYRKLSELLPNIKLFNSDAANNIFVDEDAIIGMGWNGDVFKDMKENPNLVFIYPKDGFPIWLDCVAIPKYAPHLADAHIFINFILRPDIALKIALEQGYSTPNLEALKLLPIELQNNQVINPSAEILKHGEFQAGAGEADFIYEKYWEKLKIGG